MMNKIVLMTLVATLVGCASSGPVPIGKDTFMISKQSAGGMFVAASSIKVEIIKEAYAFCGSENKVFQLVNSQEVPSIPGRMPSAEIHFMCLAEGDGEIKRPKMQRGADTIIETRSR